MKQSNKRHILGRYALVLLGMIFMSILIIYQTFKTTIVKADLWNQKADSIVSCDSVLFPQRGKILADNGTVLAATLNYYEVRFDWRASGIKPDTLERVLPVLCDSLAQIDNIRTSEEWKDYMLKGREKNSRGFLLFKQVTYTQLERIKKFPFIKKGVVGTRKDVRIKPYGSLAARSVGTAGPLMNAKREIINDKLIHGRNGLEMALDTFLYGIPGVKKRIQLNSGFMNWGVTPATPGYDVTTTINVQLQDIVENELNAMLEETGSKWGTAVLMEVATGEIKAISNLERDSVTGKYVEGVNHAVLRYEPGSVMKPISMMIALEDGVVTDINKPWPTGSEWIYCKRAIRDPHGGAALSARQIIEMSSNIGMSKLTVLYGKYGKDPAKFRDRLEEMGFFEPFNSGIAGELVPLVSRLNNSDSCRVALTRQCFGYSTGIPPLRLLAMYNAIANNGRYVAPHLVKQFSRNGVVDSIVETPVIRERVCSPENAAKLRIMLHDVVWGSHGTARRWLQSDLVEIAGKTGTAYVLDHGQYGSQRRLSFCGFFPYESPKYSCIVLMKGADRGAAASSGMVLKNVALKMYARGYLGSKADYTTAKNESTINPTIYSKSKSRRDEICKAYKISNSCIPKPTTQATTGVPNVKNMNVRDAIAILEARGLKVKLDGTGFVAAQSIAPGEKYQRGQTIILTLRI
ncbi:MAG: transpeptidase family protein [Muribaculaceae bacterium]|nr:transpeptidase family protein [Muribaculaceae bacterium]